MELPQEFFNAANLPDLSYVTKALPSGTGRGVVAPPPLPVIRPNALTALFL